MEIEYVFFDLDGTLGRVTDRRGFTRAFIKGLAEILAKRIDEPLSVLARIPFEIIEDMRENPPLNRTIMEEFCIRMGRRFGKHPEEIKEAILEFYRDKFPELKIYYRKVEGARELIEKLFECGYKVGILTDPITSESAVLMRMKWVGVSGFPYCIITTGENMHAIKPHPEYFREALSKCGARAENSVLIGDDVQRDVAGAKNFGMRAILIKGSEFSEREILVRPDAVVSNFTELSRVLKEFGIKIPYIMV